MQPQPPTTKIPSKSVVPSSDSITLPVFTTMKIWRGLPTIDMSVNKGIPEPFLISTGSDHNIINQNSMERLHLAALAEKVQIHILDATTEASMTTLKTVTLKQFMLEDVPFAAANVAALLSRDPLPDAPLGWLGAPILSKYQITIDIKNSIFQFEKPETPLPGKLEKIIVPIKVKDGLPYVNLAIPGGKSFPALLDTSSRGTFIPASVIAKLKIKPIRTEKFTDSAGKPGTVSIARLPTMSVGKVEWKMAQVFYITTENPDKNHFEPAILGIDFISQYRVTINYKRQQMVLYPPTIPKVSPKDNDNL